MIVDSVARGIKLLIGYLRADVSKYRPEVYKSEKSKILKKIHELALGKLLTLNVSKKAFLID